MATLIFPAQDSRLPKQSPNPSPIGGASVDLARVVEDEDRLSSLRELRNRLAVEVDATSSARDVAALSQRLMDVLAQIEQVEQARSAPRSNARDEVARKRAERASAAARPRRAARRAQ